MQKGSKMKLACLAKPTLLGLIAASAFVGCRNSPTPLTVLPKNGSGALAGTGSLDGSKLSNTDAISSADKVASGVPQNNPADHAGWLQDASALEAYVVHFDFDSSVIKESEKSKLSAVAEQLKSKTTVALRVDGHCDERGTEEYNRSLAERRAIALREELVLLGIDPSRVDTCGYGEDKPAAIGHSEEAYSKNRRGEFILLMPPQLASLGAGN